MKLKDSQRIKIEKDIAEYLSNGKTIDAVDHTANHNYKQPTRRTKKEQIEYRKKHHLPMG